jgi:hypothetical protein
MQPWESASSSRRVLDPDRPAAMTSPARLDGHQPATEPARVGRP